MLCYMHVRWLFPCDTTTVGEYSSRKSSLVIIILRMLHPSPDGPHHSISLLPCPCLHFHISLSSSVSSHHLILSLWGADKNRERETQKDKEKAEEDKNKFETNRNQKTDLSKNRSQYLQANAG